MQKNTASGSRKSTRRTEKLDKFTVRKPFEFTVPNLRYLKLFRDPERFRDCAKLLHL